MSYLLRGERALPVTDAVARVWDRIVDEARIDAERTGLLGAWVSYRTDTGAVGSLPVDPGRAPVLIEGDAESGSRLGTIVSASADPDVVTREALARVGPQEEWTEERIAGTVRELREERPDLNWDAILAGPLAGPASADRPPVPVWDYPAHLEQHPELRLADLTAFRFPVRHLGAPWSVTSIDEELAPPPAHLRERLGPPRFRIDAPAVIRRFAMLHETGVIEWDPEQRGIAYVQGLRASRIVLHAWLRTLEPNDAAPAPGSYFRSAGPET